MTENHFFTHEPKLNIHHEYSVFSCKTPMYIATVLRIFSITDYPQLCKFFLLPLPHSVPLCNPKTIPSQNVNSTIQGLYQRSCWYGSFFIYLLLKERRFSPCRFSTSLSLFGYPSTVSPALLMTLSRSSCGRLCSSR